jgi:anti-sigma regulatory factor (Ser/Thr protein kinase)
VVASESTTATSFSVRLPYGAGSAATARRLVTDLLSGRVDPASEVVADATLVVHELVVNGLTHGRPDARDEIEVSARIADGELVITVRDQGSGGTVAALHPTDDSDHGRGLSIVATLSSSWAVDRSSGTRVSARLRL